jgi:hypothetical protein
MARCVYCRVEVAVPDSYAHGDHIKCGSCGTGHKVIRQDGVRLVLADVGPLKDKLIENEKQIGRLQDELQGARRSFGIGVNGLGLGVVYLLWQFAFKERPLDTDLLLRAGAIALVSGVLLELLNYLLLAKRQQIASLTRDIEQAQAHGRELRKLIRQAER